jgi:hypothetical protein
LAYVPLRVRAERRRHYAALRDRLRSQRPAKSERKRLQIEHAALLSPEAKLVKLADKICNLRDVAVRPPANWDLARRREYFDWAKRVVDGGWSAGRYGLEVAGAEALIRSAN